MWKDWEEIWYLMSGHDVAQYEYLKGMAENEFYTLMDLHKKRLEKLKNNHQSHR